MLRGGSACKENASEPILLPLSSANCPVKVPLRILGRTTANDSSVRK